MSAFFYIAMQQAQHRLQVQVLLEVSFNVDTEREWRSIHVQKVVLLAFVVSSHHHVPSKDSLSSRLSLSLDSPHCHVFGMLSYRIPVMVGREVDKLSSLTSLARLCVSVTGSL